LTLTSNPTSPTSIIFNSTSSSNTPLFSIGIGTLAASYVGFMYDSSAVDTFISLTDAGFITFSQI
jgi:hypothetical protein